MKTNAVAPILACAALFARAVRLTYEQMRFKLDSLYTRGLEPSTLHGIATHVVADTAMREQPGHEGAAIEAAIDGTPVIVYPSEDARPGWVLARMPSGAIGFLFVVHVDMREARRYLFAQLKDALERDPLEIERALDELLGATSAV